MEPVRERSVLDPELDAVWIETDSSLETRKGGESFLFRSTVWKLKNATNAWISADDDRFFKTRLMALGSADVGQRTTHNVINSPVLP